MNLLVDVVDKQLEEVRALPQIAYKWDVWIGLERSVLEIQVMLKRKRGGGLISFSRLRCL